MEVHAATTYHIDPINNVYWGEGLCGTMSTYVISDQAPHAKGHRTTGEGSIQIKVGIAIIYDVRADVLAANGVTLEAMNGERGAD